MKYSSQDADSTSFAAMSRWFRIILNEGRFLGLMLQHCVIRMRNPSGQVDGMCSVIDLLPTPYNMHVSSTSLYGASPVNNSQRTTPYDLQHLKVNFGPDLPGLVLDAASYHTSTFSEQGSCRITSGAIQATVPAKLIIVLFSFHSRLVPKSLIFITSPTPMSTLRNETYSITSRLGRRTHVTRTQQRSNKE